MTEIEHSFSEYLCLGKIRQQTTSPQVELGWKTKFLENTELSLYVSTGNIYNALLGKLFSVFSGIVHLGTIQPVELNRSNPLFQPQHQGQDRMMSWKEKVWDWIESHFKSELPDVANGFGSNVVHGKDGSFTIINMDDPELCCTCYEIDAHGPTGVCLRWESCEKYGL